MKPQELVDMLLAVCGESFQFDCNTALEAVDVVRDVMDDLDALNLALKANKEMLATETARADKAEQQRDALLCDLSKHQRQAAIGRAIERAYEELPDGCHLDLALENGEATVRLFTSKWDTYIHDFGSDVTLSEEVDNAINIAITCMKGGA